MKSYKELSIKKKKMLPYTFGIIITFLILYKVIMISTSSGTVGHSLSFGKADAVMITADNAILSDAVATGIGNLVLTENDIPRGLEKAMSIPGVRGVLIIKAEEMGLCGNLAICRTSFD